MTAFIISALVGIAVGILSGLLGIGGGVVMVPVFRLGFAMQAIEATATSLFAIIPTSLAGCIAHIRNRTCLVPLGVIAGIAGACTSPFGVYLASVSPSWLIMLVAAGIIGYSAVTMLRKALRSPKPEKGSAAGAVAKRKAARADAAAPSSDVLESASASAAVAAPPRLTGRQLAIGALIGLGTGIASGYVGVGGGFIMVPLFLSVLAVDMRYASGTSLIAVTILAIPGAIAQGMLGNVQVLAGLAIAVGSIPGALIGASLVKRVPERMLRLFFGIMLLCVAVLLAVNEFAVGA